MAQIGVNVDRSGRHAAPWLQSLGFRGARIVLMRDEDLRPLLSSYEMHGIHTLGVLARESFAGFGSWEEGLAYYARQYGQWFSYPGSGSLQMGNEADHESPSSWSLPPERLSQLGQEAREAFPNARLVCSGMVSGQPGYLDDVDLSPFTAIAVHPYAKDQTANNDLPQASELIAQYRRFNLPLWVTEWGWWGDEARGEYEVRDMLSWAVSTDEIEWYFHFCADDLMVPPFGLLRSDGSWKPAAHAAYAVLMADAPPIEPSPPDVPWIGDGLLRELEEHNWTPVSGEHRSDNPLVLAKTSSGKDAVVIWDVERQEARAYRRV